MTRCSSSTRFRAWALSNSTSKPVQSTRYSADAHKFLLGPEGVSLFYVSRRAMERVKPTLVGWLSVNNPEDYLNYDQPYAPSARRFESGALNAAGVAGLAAAIELFLQGVLKKLNAI
jgi:selenocysteine lyase/cysteine desulfurase